MVGGRQEGAEQGGHRGKKEDGFGLRSRQYRWEQHMQYFIPFHSLDPLTQIYTTLYYPRQPQLQSWSQVQIDPVGQHGLALGQGNPGAGSLTLRRPPQTQLPCDFHRCHFGTATNPWRELGKQEGAIEVTLIITPLVLECALLLI